MNNFKEPPLKKFQRLETDSSEDEAKETTNRASVLIQTEENFSLHEELAKKDLEITKLKQILQEIQEKLNKKSEKTQNIKKETQITEEKEENLQVDKKLFGKIEEIVFVSKKNKLNFEGNSDEEGKIQKNLNNDDKKGNEAEGFGLDLKDVKIFKENNEEIKEIKEDNHEDLKGNMIEGNLDGDHLKTFDENTERLLKQRKDLEALVGSSSDDGLRASDLGTLVRNGKHINKNDEFNKSPVPVNSNEFNKSLKLNDSSKFSSPINSSNKTSLKALENSLNRINPAKPSTPSQTSHLSSLTSLREFEAILGLSQRSSSSSSSSSQSPQVDPVSQKSKTDQGTLTDNIPQKPFHASYTFDPVFQIMSDNFPDPSKSLIKKSRNSSLPWIDDSLSTSKAQLKPSKKQIKSRPKTQEKPFILKQGKTQQKSQLVHKKPAASAGKEPLVQIRFRANSHNKTKARPRPAEKHSLRHLAKEDILDDILFDEEQDTATWTKLMNKFRQNPVIISRLLRSRGRPSTQEDLKRTSKKFEKINQVEYIGVNSAMSKKPEVSSINSVIDFRPVSAPEIAPGNSANGYRRVKDPDWSCSLLDTLVTQNKKKFNFIGDLNLMSSQDIEDFIKLMQNNVILDEDLKKVFRKVANTLENLKKELVLPEFWVSIPPFSRESLAQALSKCQKLFKARTLTIKAIELIHYRESLLLDIMSFASGDKEKFVELEKVNDELLQVLVFWKYMELPFTSFVYLGEDYYAKIHEDNSNLASIFPQFKVEDVFKAQVNDSFDFDI